MNCEVAECDVSVNKPGHTLCYDHWIENRDGLLSRCASCNRLKDGNKPLCYPCYKKKSSGAAPSDDDDLLSATDLGAAFGVSAQRLNLVLAELGWVNREPTKGWTPTAQGRRAGAVGREARQSGIPYVVWSSKVRTNKALIAALRGNDEDIPFGPEPVIADGARMEVPTVIPSSTQSSNFRDAHETPYRTQDGHRVRSRAELVIDDWLYHHGLVHAYERRLPIEEDVICDFWLPRSRVYIEYWGMEQNEAYAERKRVKKAIYAKNELQLVEIGDEELKSLDDHLPRLLRRYGVAVD